MISIENILGLVFNVLKSLFVISFHDGKKLINMYNKYFSIIGGCCMFVNRLLVRK